MIKNEKCNSIFKKKLVKKIEIIGLTITFLTVLIFINWYQNPEPLASVKSINTAPPDTNILDGPTGTIDYNDVVFTWIGSDDTTLTEQLQYSYILEGKGSEWSSWASSTSTTYNNLSNEEYAFKVKAKNEVGNIDPTPAQRSFTVDTDEWNEDTAPPDTNILDGPTGTIDYNNVTFTWTGSDDVTPIEDINYSYKLEGYDNDWSSFFPDTSKNYSDLQNGDYSFKIIARDEAGNINPTPAERAFTVNVESGDTNPPETTIADGPTGTIDYNNVTFTWTASDDVTHTENLQYSYKLVGIDSSWSSWKTDISKTYNNLPNGDYIFKVKAKDEAGNIDPTPAEKSFRVDIDESEEDTVAPDTSILTGPTGTIDYNNVTFAWTGFDDVTPTGDLRYSYKLEPYDTYWLSWTTSISTTYTSLPNGDYTFKVKAKDEADNIDPTPAQQSFTVEVGGEEPDRFATSVIDFTGGGSTDLILGGPRGRGESQGSTHVLSLGTSGIVTLGFDVSIANGPGEDFIVFENPFSILDQYGDPTGMVFAELVYVEVSTDGINFVRFPSISRTANPVNPYQGICPENVTNLAGVYPVFANVDQNDIDPFDPDGAGGDAFDLDDLLDYPLVQNGVVDLQNICYLKIIDILGDGLCLDSQGNPIYDPTGFGNNGADIDSVAVINYRV